MTDHLTDALYISILTSSLFILAVVLLRALFRRRISMRLQYALWLLVAVRLLLLPVPLLESPLSVLRVLNAWHVPQNAPSDAELDALISKTALPADHEAVSAAPTESKLLPANVPWNPDQTQKQTVWSRSKIGRLCMLAAAVGSGVVFLYFLLGNIRFTVYLHQRRMRYEENGWPLPVYLVDGLPSPCLYGRAIYIAPSMAEDAQKLSHILTHEYCHYRQGDFLWSVIRCLCVCLYWWNPLVWLAAYLSRQDCELSCDEAALQLLGNRERIPYGKTLIELIPVKDADNHYCSIATTMSEGGRSMKRRIKQITANPKATGSLCILLTALALFCFVSMSTTASTLPDSETQLPEDEQITLPGEPTCTYIMQVDEDNDYLDIPSLSLNEEEQTFSFCGSALSSYLIFGTYEVKEDILTATTSDGLYQYQFRIEDETTLIYMSGSDASFGVPNNGTFMPKIVDGSRFCRSVSNNGADITSTPADEQTHTDTVSAIHDLDQAVALAVLSFNSSRFLAEECTAEGHIILDSEIGTDRNTTVYALTMYGEYQFQDNALIKESGTGAIPVVMTFSYDKKEGYALQSYEEPMDGSYYTESIHELFPKYLWETCISLTEEDVRALTEQEQSYALRYLQQLGREAVVGHYGDMPHTLLTDAGVSVEVSNLMVEYEKYDELWKYPYWIGNVERVEDGVRYVYAMALDSEKHEIIYTKSEYDTQRVVDTHVFDSLTGAKKQ